MEGNKLFSYTVSKIADNDAFKNECKRIERLGNEMEKEPLVIDVDGSAYQVYRIGGKKITVSNDYMVDAVYVDSEVEINK